MARGSWLVTRSSWLVTRGWWLAAGLVAANVVLAAAQPAAQPTTQNVETDPLTCWWRTSTGAIRVGETFTTVLTCAVLETPEVKVIVDESKLEPSVVQFAPFETIGGTHAVDLRSGDRRFFQYEYRLRVIAENLFGKDVPVQETKLSYRVQSTVSQKAAVEGRDQTYVLPALALRVLSLVPVDASDIRDGGSESFAGIDRRAFRANLLVVIGGVLYTLAGLVALLALVRLYISTRAPATTADRLVSDAAILRGVGRELNAVQRDRDGSGWTADLAARALTALRIISTYALGREPARAQNATDQTAATTQSLFEGGGLVVETGLWKKKPIAVSGHVTARLLSTVIARARDGRRPGELESLEEALNHFTVAQYGKPLAAGGTARLDDAGLDQSMAAGRDVLKRLKFERTWIMRRLTKRKTLLASESRVWSR